MTGLQLTPRPSFQPAICSILDFCKKTLTKYGWGGGILILEVWIAKKIWCCREAKNTENVRQRLCVYCDENDVRPVPAGPAVRS